MMYAVEYCVISAVRPPTWAIVPSASPTTRSVTPSLPRARRKGVVALLRRWWDDHYIDAKIAGSVGQGDIRAQ